jgi:RNA polymerase sigma factor (sigma-70 family)
MAVDSEPRLVMAARQGDREALESLLTQNWAWLRGIVYSVLLDGCEVDDALQDVCLRVITRIRTLRDPGRFRAWLAVLARREALRYRRRGRRVATMPAGAEGTGPAWRTDDPVAKVERSELCGRVLETLRNLPAKYREVFVLAHSGELTYAQMAEVLDVPLTTMQIRLVRARRMIREQVVREDERRLVEHEQDR